MIVSSRSKSVFGTSLARDEAGGITALNLFFIMVLAILAGVAIDLANLIQARTKLQVAADTTEVELVGAVGQRFTSLLTV